ncbi:MAG: hypothetical protein DMG06_17875, partial [Acidobacteria bacterium]
MTRNHSFNRVVCLFVSSLMFFVACSKREEQNALAGGELTLVENGKSSYAISIPPNAPAPTRFAATEIQKYIRSVSEAELPIQENSAAENVIALGPVQNSKYHLLDEHPGEDGFLVITNGSRIELLGTNPRSELYAAYWFLEKYLGCGWLYPGDDVVPKSENIKLPAAIVEIEKPSFSYRALMLFPYSLARSLQDIDWMAKNCLNYAHVAVNSSREGPVLGLRLWDKYKSRETFIPELEKRGLNLHFGGHTYFTWVPPEKYFQEHPEYFSLIGGKRVAKSLCISNVDVAKVAAENMIDFVKSNPETDVIDLWITDADDWCECAACRKMEPSARHTIQGGKDESKSDSAVQFVNAVANEFGKKYPKILVNFLAYSRVIDAPIRTKPAPNVLVGYAPISRAYNKRGSKEGYYSPLYDNTDKQNRAYLEEMNKWLNLTKNFYLYDYYTLWQSLGTSRSKLHKRLMEFFPIIETMGQDTWYYRYRGISGISTEQFDWPELNMYAYAHLIWDPNQSVQQIIEGYCRKYYGAAEAPMLSHWLALEQAKGEWKSRSAECLGYIEQA